MRNAEAPSLQVEKAEWMPARRTKIPFGPGGGMDLDLPEHCLVTGVIERRTGIGGQAFGIHLELRLPSGWNGGFLFQGGGGLGGFVAPAIGMAGPGQTPALGRGFAVVSMDTGHRGMDATFASDQQARLNYAYQAIGKVTAEAKELIARFYGRAIAHSYFVGCSNGGREALLAAERYPLDFDGIVAGNPGLRLSRAAVAQLWDTAQLLHIAPKDLEGKPIYGKALNDDDLRRVSAAVVDECDALDGLRDGMVNDIHACRFDPGVLACPDGGAGDCLSQDKVAVIKAIFEGAHDSRGQPLYAGWFYDAGISAPDWRNWKMGTSPTAQSNGLNQTLGLDALRHYFSTPADPQIDPATFDFDRAEALTAETGAINDAASTFLTTFAQRGGRLLLYHGVSDPVFSLKDSIAWYEGVRRVAPDAGDFARLFAIPGMCHCAGGPATFQFDSLGVIQAWVEDGKAPDRVLATGPAFPGVTRPLCPYPAVARFTGGDQNSADSFACTE
jgi:feruloyl esterase